MWKAQRSSARFFKQSTIVPRPAFAAMAERFDSCGRRLSSSQNMPREAPMKPILLQNNDGRIEVGLTHRERRMGSLFSKIGDELSRASVISAQGPEKEAAS